jgi:hypothetical protein
MAKLFERELKSFKARLTPGEQSSFTGTTIEDLRLTIASIQKTQISERTNKNVARLRKFLEAVESYSKVLDVFVKYAQCVIEQLVYRLSVVGLDLLPSTSVLRII